MDLSDDTGLNPDAPRPSDAADPPHPPPRPPQAQPPGFGHRALVWAVLWLAVLVTFGSIQLQYLMPGGEAQLIAHPGPMQDELLTGRLAVAFDAMRQQVPPMLGDHLASEAAKAVEQMRNAAVRPGQQVRVITIIAEVHDVQAARQAIQDLAQRNQFSQDQRQDLATLGDIYSTRQVDPDARDLLLARHGWFAELALVHDRPAGDPQRQRVIGTALRTAYALVGVTIGMFVVGGAGLVLFIVAMVLLVQGKLTFRYRPPPHDRRIMPYLETAAVFLALMLFLSLILMPVLMMLELPLGWLLPVLLAMTLFWPLLRRVDWASFRRAMGWQRGRGIWREIGAGIVGYVACLPIVALGFAGTLLLTQLLGTQMHHPATEEVAMGTWQAILMVLMLGVVWAPLVEESLFRGVFYHYMRSSWGILASALITGLVFAAIHPQGIVGLPALTAVGVAMALLREWRGSLVGPIAAHALHNLVLILMVLLLFA